MQSSALAISLTVSTLVISISIGLLLYAFLLPETQVRVFVTTLGMAMIAAVGFNVAYIIRAEQEKRKRHEGKSRVDPRYCPDYWRNNFDPCTGNSCLPVFEEASGSHVIMSDDHAQNVGTPLTQLIGANGQGLCQTRDERGFPWVEVDIACDARERLT